MKVTVFEKVKQVGKDKANSYIILDGPLSPMLFSMFYIIWDVYTQTILNCSYEKLLVNTVLLLNYKFTSQKNNYNV